MEARGMFLALIRTGLLSLPISALAKRSGAHEAIDFKASTRSVIMKAPTDHSIHCYTNFKKLVDGLVWKVEECPLK